MKEIKWFAFKGNQIVIRKFRGELENETETTVTFKYNKKMLTLKKEECFIFTIK